MIAYIDILDACNLSCRTCCRGLKKMKTTNTKMDITTFIKILKKMKNEKIIDRIGIFNWTEPFLHEQISDFIFIAKELGFYTVISSNFSLNNIQHQLELSCKNGLDSLIISVSGFTNDIHNKNHMGSDIDTVKKNILDLNILFSKYKFKTHVIVKYLEFSYNLDQISLFENFVKQTCFEFVKEKASGDPLKHIINEDISIKVVTDKIGTFSYKKRINSLNFCDLIFNTIPIDCYGNVYTCCERINNDFFYIGNFLDISIENITAMRLLHPACQHCYTSYNANEHKNTRYGINTLIKYMLDI